MPTVKATAIRAMLFVKKDALYYDANGVLKYDISKLEPQESEAYTKLDIAAGEMAQRHGATWTGIFALTFHPFLGQDPQNTVFVNQNGGRVPLLYLEADYPDAPTKYYIVKPGITGLGWTETEALQMLEILAYNYSKGEQSILCKYLPFLCKIPAWVWLGLTVYAAKEAYTEREQPKKNIKILGAFLSFDSFGQAGGFKAILPNRE